jgi:hypothetical protein
MYSLLFSKDDDARYADPVRAAAAPATILVVADDRKMFRNIALALDSAAIAIIYRFFSVFQHDNGSFHNYLILKAVRKRKIGRLSELLRCTRVPILAA